MENRYLTLKETAEMTHTAYATVKRDVDNGKLTAYKLGRKYFIAADAAADYAARRRKMAALDGYTVKELMEILPLSYAFIIGEIREGRLPAAKCGRRFLIRKEDLADYLEKAKI